MKERGIIMSAAMVKALLEGRKTQTRRVIQMRDASQYNFRALRERLAIFELRPGLPVKTGRGLKAQLWMPCFGVNCPYGVAGDRLWVRETFARVHPGLLQHLDPDPDSPHWEIIYRANELGGYLGQYKDAGVLTWKPSIFMPRRASRITLEITGVRVERLQEISEEDALAEGCEQLRSGGTLESNVVFSAKERYRDLWDSINGKGAWELNPWVWVLGFKRITP